MVGDSLGFWDIPGMGYSMDVSGAGCAGAEVSCQNRPKSGRIGCFKPSSKFWPVASGVSRLLAAMGPLFRSKSMCKPWGSAEGC